MPRETRNEITAGIFTLVALALLIAVIFWLGVSNIFKPTAQTAYFYVGEDNGKLALQTDGQVMINDVVVGRITSIELDPEKKRTMYVVRIERDDVKVYCNGKAKVAAALVGGANLVILDRGTDDSVLADRQHPVEIQPGEFEQAMSQVGKLTTTVAQELDREREGSVMAKIHSAVDEINTALDSASKALKSVEGEMDAKNKMAMLAKLHETMDSIRTIASDAQPLIKNTLTNIDDMAADANPKVKNTLSNVEEISKDFKRITKEDIGQMLVELRKANTKILTIAENFAAVSQEAKEILVVNRESFDKIIDDLTLVSGNLKAASAEIRRNPWRLLYKPKKGELHSQNIYDAAREFSSGASQLDRISAKLTGLVRANPEGMPADDPQLKKIREEIKEAFSKFSKAEQALWKELK